jgi:hypothetical protein
VGRTTATRGVSRADPWCAQQQQQQQQREQGRGQQRGAVSRADPRASESVKGCAAQGMMSAVVGYWPCGFDSMTASKWCGNAQEATVCKMQGRTPVAASVL